VFVFLPFHIELRYFAPIFPILLLWLARGIDAFASWLQQTWENWGSPLTQGSSLGRVLLVLLAVPVLVYFLLLQPRVVHRGLENMNPSRREAGLWLRANSPEHVLIMSRDPEVPFYAQRDWAATPNEEYRVFIDYLRRRGADYLVIDEREVTVIRPQLSFLLDANSPPPELRHVYTAGAPGATAIVYEVLD
jgi:hypothetical protein